MISPQFVTFTGLDSKTDLARVQALSKRYPVEWGILFGGKIGYQLNKRYPGDQTVIAALNADIRLSAHLCGRFARYAMNPDAENADDILPRINAWRTAKAAFRRVQVNAVDYDIPALERFQSLMNLPLIMQTRGNAFPEPLDGLTYLHDPSGGRGIEPPSRPRQMAAMPLVGYAGGIGPENVREVIASLDAHAYYIDMETKIRTDDWLDLDRCETVCQQVWPDLSSVRQKTHGSSARGMNGATNLGFRCNVE
jgi:hypothetical protein